jgi:mycothiol synthase
VSIPAGWTARRPTLDDMPAILDVVHASDTAAIGHPDFDLDDVRDVLTAPHVALDRDFWVAEDPDGRLVAWANLANPSGAGREFVEVYVDPERGQPVQAALLARQLDRVAERAAARGLPSLTVRCAAHEPERHWLAVLRAAGFGFVKRYARMRRSLAGVPAEPPSPPSGVSIRPVRPGDEDDLRRFHHIFDTAFRDTPDYEPAGYDEWRRREARPEGTPWDEWYLAEIDGEPVGALQSSNQAAEQNEGFVPTLSVLPTHRGRGVGAALLRHAFAGYAARGRDFAGLGVDLTNPTEAVRLYRAVGLADLRTVDMFERQVAAAG